MNIQSAVAAYIDSIYRESRRFYPEGKQPHVLDLSTGEFGDQVSHQPLNTLFGFVPVFRRDGKTEIYVRFGGPESIIKMSGDGFNVDPDAGSAYGYYDTIPNTTRDGAGYEFGANYNALIGNQAVNTLYSIRLAEERHVLQEAVLDRLRGDTEAILNRLRRKYAFKLVPSDNKVFDVYYSNQGSEYVPLGSTPSAYEGLGVDLILDTLDHLFSNPDYSADQLKSVLVQAKTEAGQTAAVQALIAKLADDFNITAFDGLTYGAYHRISDNALDHLWWSAFLQFESRPRPDDLDVTPLLSRSVEAIKNTVITSESKSALKDKTDLILSRYALDSEAAAAVIGDDTALRDEADNLRKRVKDLESANKDLESQKKHTSVHRYVGMAAGAGSAYLSVKDMDIEDWKKIAVVAAGGALGMIPVFNYLSIALTPLAVKYGAQALEGTQYARIVQRPATPMLPEPTEES